MKMSIESRSWKYWQLVVAVGIMVLGNLMIGLGEVARAQEPGSVIIINPEILWPPPSPDIIVTDPHPPIQFQLRSLNIGEIASALQSAPMEGSGNSTLMALPLPGGLFANVNLVESPLISSTFRVMTDDGSQVSEIPIGNLNLSKTYSFRGAEDPSFSGRLIFDGEILQALIHTADGLIRINPISTNQGFRYASFLSTSRTDGADEFVHSPDEQFDPNPPQVPIISPLAAVNLAASLAETGGTLRQFRLAVAATAEYTAARNTNPNDGLSDVVNSILAEINNVNLLLESEVAVRLSFDWVWIYQDPNNDPYNTTASPNSSAACNLREQNDALDAAIGSDNYDLGFVFGTDDLDNDGTLDGNNSGCAWYVLCKADKYRGAAIINVTNPPGNATGVLLHEMGHQMDARHTFSGSACLPNEYNARAAYEPGSGTTIMSYRNACNEDRDGDGNLDVAEDANNNMMLDPGEDLDGDGNLDVNEDRNGNGMLDNDNVAGISGVGNRYYHSISFDEIINNTTALVDNNTCGMAIATGNNPPVVDAGPDFTIPRNTPFTLTGSATDPDGDALTYVWEQFDQGNPARPIDSAGLTDGPIFRSLGPVASAEAPNHSRTFPRLPDILSGTQRRGEILPTVDRSMTFRLTARDNRLGGGGVSSDTMGVTVVGSPFLVTSPNGGETIGGGCVAPVEWIVGGGSVANDVNLLLSEDGGTTFNPLLAATPNDGLAATMFSCNATTQARVKAEGAGNIFFDISDNDFAITPQPPSVTITQALGGAVDHACLFTVTYAATVTDDCGVVANDVSVDAIQTAGIATRGPLQVNAVQLDGTTVSVTGSFAVSDVKLDENMNPATFRIDVTGVDACGLPTTDSQQVTVVDTTPPTIAVSATPDSLWPPNHQLVDVTTTVTVADNCPMTMFALKSATSDEPDNGIADGDTANDIQNAEVGLPDTNVRLRSERAGTRDGRTYTLAYTAEDGSKNTAQSSATVSVPHNQ